MGASRVLSVARSVVGIDRLPARAGWLAGYCQWCCRPRWAEEEEAGEAGFCCGRTRTSPSLSAWLIMLAGFF